MRLDLRSRHLDHPPTHAFVRRRVQFALDRFEDRLERVTVRVADENGPRGGVDKRCRVEVAVRRGPPVQVTAAHADARTAVARAVHKAAQAVDRRLTRERGR